MGASVPLARSRDQRREDEDLEREGRVRTAISGLETWRISKAMLLPHWDAHATLWLTASRNFVFGGGGTADQSNASGSRLHAETATPELRAPERKSGTPRAEQTFPKNN